MSKRYLITLPDAIANLIDGWAEAEDGKASGIISFLVEKDVRELEGKGLIPKPVPDYKEFKHLILDNYDKLSEHPKLKERISDLLEGDPPSEIEVVRVACLLKLPENYVQGLINNGNPATNV